MADVRNDQYLHRPGAGRGAVSPADPLEARLYDGAGQPIAPATEGKQDQLISALGTLANTLGTEATLALVKAALDVLVSKDFATQTTLAAVLEKLADLATESTLDGVKSAVDALASTVDAGAQKVTLTGRIDALRNNIATGSKTVTATAAEIFAGSSRLAGRHAMVITNVGVGHVYIGASGVTTGNGFPLFPGDTVRLDFDPANNVPVFAVSGGPDVEVRVVELA